MDRKRYLAHGMPYRNLLSLLAIMAAAMITVPDAIAQQLQPGDGVRLTFYNIDEDRLSGDYFVMNDWNIQLPYLRLVDVREREFDGIRNEISQHYSKIYKDPELTIQPLFKVNVLGEVRQPGVYYVTGIEHLTDLLALAGGETQNANLDKIFLIRDTERVRIDASEILQEGQQLNDFGLISGDQVYVSREGLLSFRNASLLISGLGLAATVAAIFIVRS